MDKFGITCRGSLHNVLLDIEYVTILRTAGNCLCFSMNEFTVHVCNIAISKTFVVSCSSLMGHHHTSNYCNLRCPYF